MKRIHYLAILLFVIAFVLYFISSAWGTGFAVAGMLVETCAWIAAFSESEKSEKD